MKHLSEAEEIQRLSNEELLKIFDNADKLGSHVLGLAVNEVLTRQQKQGATPEFISESNRALLKVARYPVLSSSISKNTH